MKISIACRRQKKTVEKGQIEKKTAVIYGFHLVFVVDKKLIYFIPRNLTSSVIFFCSESSTKSYFTSMPIRFPSSDKWEL